MARFPRRSRKIERPMAVASSSTEGSLERAIITFCAPAIFSATLVMISEPVAGVFSSVFGVVLAGESAVSEVLSSIILYYHKRINLSSIS